MQKFSNPKVVASVLLMAGFVALAVALPRKVFDLLWVVMMMAGAALASAMFAKRGRLARLPAAGPGKSIFALAMIFLACVCFSSLYLGLGLPSPLARWNDLAFAFAEALFLPFITAFIVAKVRHGVARWGSLTAEHRAGVVAAALGGAAAVPVGVVDLIRRVLDLVR